MARWKKGPLPKPEGEGIVSKLTDKLSSLGDKIQSFVGETSTIPNLPAEKKKEETLSEEDKARKFAEAVERALSKSLPHLFKKPGKEDSKAQYTAGTKGPLPIPTSAVHKEPGVNVPPEAPAQKDNLPEWLKYQIGLAEHKLPTPKVGIGLSGLPGPKAKEKEPLISATGIGKGVHSFITGGHAGGISELAGGLKTFSKGASSLGGATGAFGGIAGAFAGPAGFTALISAGSEKLKQWTQHLHESNVQFAEFSGAMRQVQIESQIRQMQLSRIRGERRAPSARFLAEQKDALAKAMSPTEDFLADIKNYVVGDLAAILTGSFEMLTTIGSYLGIIKENTQKDEGFGQDERAWSDHWMKEMEKSKWYQWWGRPRRMGEPGHSSGGGMPEGEDF